MRRSCVGTKWTEEEKAALRRYYPLHRSSVWKGWKRHIPNRSPDAIQRKAVELGLTRRKRCGSKPWSDEETQELLRWLIEHSRKWDRTPMAVAMHAEWLCQRALAMRKDREKR